MKKQNSRKNENSSRKSQMAKPSRDGEREAEGSKERHEEEIKTTRERVVGGEDRPVRGTSRVGNIREMHKILRELGGRDRNAMDGHNITKFKEHFLRVSQDRYEMEPQEME